MAHACQTLIPQPRVIHLRKTTQRVPHHLSVTMNGLSSQDESTFNTFLDRALKPWTGGGPHATLPVNARLSRRRLPGIPALPPDLAEQAYVLDVGRTISLTARDLPGLRHGIQTLKQMLEESEAVGTLPHCRIADWPRLAARGIHYDLARETAFRPAHIRQVIDRVAYFKMNQLHLYLENKFIFPSCPEAAPPDAMTPRQAKALCRYAALQGVTIIPQISTLGHMDHHLYGKLARFREDPKYPWNLCPTHPGVRPWLAGLIRDIGEGFGAPFLHIGYDESHAGTCRRCRRHGSPQDLLASHLNWLDAEVKKQGARTMIYGDKFIPRDLYPRQDAANGGTPAQASKALATVNRDIIITNWHYTAPYSGTTRFFVDQGFTVYGATANNTYWHDAVPLRQGQEWIVETVENDTAQGIVGAFHCNWEHYRGQYIDNFWTFNALAAERYWTDKEHDRQSWGARFSQRFYGTDRDHYSEIMSLAEVIPTARRTCFVEWPALQFQGGEAFERQASLTYAETGERILLLSRQMRKSSTRNRSSLRMIDIYGEIIRYLGVRAQARTALAAALAQGQKRHAIGAARSVLTAALHVRQRFEEAYRDCGCSVIDRLRIDRQIGQLRHTLTELQKCRAAELPHHTLEALIARSRKAIPDLELNFDRRY